MKSIKLENARFFGYHGFYEEEVILGNEFSVDISVDLAEPPVKINDELAKTLNYESLFSVCKEVMMGQRKQLLESLAEEMCDRIRSRCDKAIMIKVQVAKLNPPLSGRVERSVVEYLWKS